MVEGKGASPQNGAIFRDFSESVAEFSESIAGAMVRYFEQESRPELEYVRIQMIAFQTTFESVIRELRSGFDGSEDETRTLVERHVSNTGATVLLKSASGLFKKVSITGIIEKIIPILELIKKIINQIIEKFPNFMERWLKGMILPLLEILDNILPLILDLFSGGSGSKLLLQAEARFLDTHPKWRRMYFETQAPGTDFS